MARVSGPEQPRSSTPGTLPDVTPAASTGYTADFTMQTMLEMQRTLGDIGAKVDRMSSDLQRLDSKIDGYGEKLEKLRHWQSRLLGGAAVLTVVVAIVWTVLNIVPWSRLRLDPAPTAQHSATDTAAGNHR